MPGGSGDPAEEHSQPPPPSSIPAQTHAPQPTAPRPGAWQSAGTLAEFRRATRVTTIAGGRVVVVGSDPWCFPGGVTAQSQVTEVGDPLAGRWTTAGQLRRPREFFALVALPGGSALAIGGNTDQLEDGVVRSFRSTYRFDPVALAWERSGDLGVARTAPLVTALSDGRILVAGGFYVDGVGYAPELAVRAAEIFDPKTGSWSTTGSMTVGRGGSMVPYSLAGAGAQAVTMRDGRVLVVGGLADDRPIRATELFDPGTGLWTVARDLPSDFLPTGLVALRDGGALVTGERSQSFLGRVSAAGLGVTLRFNAQTGTWTQAAHMLGRFEGRTVMTLADGRVLAAGGEADVPVGEPAFVADAELYDPTADRWLPTVPMPEPRRSGAGALLPDGSVLLLAGLTGVLQLGDPSCGDQMATAVRYVPVD